MDGEGWGGTITHELKSGKGFTEFEKLLKDENNKKKKRRHKE